MNDQNDVKARLDLLNRYIHYVGQRRPLSSADQLRYVNGVMTADESEAFARLCEYHIDRVQQLAT